MIFLYDSSDNAIGFAYNGDLYFYTKNHLGDVLGITDSSGTWIARYYYNAWGRQIYTKVNSEFENDVQKLAAADYNPLRYRSYMYDGWFDIYYLQSRYYSSEWGKFLNADLPEFAKVGKEQYSGTNLFAYCKNDPVNNSDPTGHWGEDVHNGYNKKTKDHYNYTFANNTAIPYGTYCWAIDKGFPSYRAKTLGNLCFELDKKYSSTMYFFSKTANITTGK